MELLIALLMVAGVLAFPVYIDIRHHGSDNILRKTLQDIVDWPPINSFIRAAQSFMRGLKRAFDVAISMSVIAGLAWLAYELWARFFR